MKVWGVFRGYSGVTRFSVNGKVRFADDEWLCGLYATESAARRAVEAFGGGKPYDDNREHRITRYYLPGDSVFYRGEEYSTEVPYGNSEWMRYEEIEIREEAETYEPGMVDYLRGTGVSDYVPDGDRVPGL